MSPYILSTVILSLGLGTAATFVGSHWIFAWIGLEINTLAIVPLMVMKHHPRAVEAITKYFLTQASAAAAILFASLINAQLHGEWNIYASLHPIPAAIIVLALALKIGLAPMHLWLPEVLQGLELITGLILSTWQKLAPFALIIQLPPGNENLLISLGLTSMLVGGWGGINQTQLRKILAYSSTAHMGWMIIVNHFAPNLTILALGMYLITTSAAFLMFKTLNTTSIKAIAYAAFALPLMTVCAPLILLSLGGLPPLSGFAPKWFIVYEFINQGLPATATIMSFSTLLSLFFYLRISHALSLTMSPNNIPNMASWLLSKKRIASLLPSLVSGAIMLLPLAPLLIAIIMSR